MAFNEFMAKIRYWDNLTAKWLMRHFYFMFFQMVLFIVFLFWFVNMFHVIDINQSATPTTVVERALTTQSVNSTIMVLLLLLNSFWMLYVFNGIQRIMNLLKDINYSIQRQSNRGRRS